MTDMYKLMSTITMRNPRAISVLNQINKNGLLSANIILTLIDLKITGKIIWKLYKDICGEDIEKTVSLIQCLSESKNPVNVNYFCQRNYCDVNVINYLGVNN